MECGLGLIYSPSHSFWQPFQQLEACKATHNRQQPANQMRNHCEWLAELRYTNQWTGEEQSGEFSHHHIDDMHE
jgi:hypothetical protein